MNKFSALSLLALVTIAGSASATVFDQCSRGPVAFTATTLSCTTPNGATAGRVTGTVTAAGVPDTIIVNHTKETNQDDRTSGNGRNNLNQSVCLAFDRNPSLASTETDTGCAGSTTLNLNVQNRDNDA
jgi:hypothetical protein